MAALSNVIHRLADYMHLHRHPADHAEGPGTREQSGETREANRRKDGYVSEFADFMDHFLDDHPEVVRDQHRGWYIWWNRKVDFRDLVKASRDTVPTAGYYYFDNPPGSNGGPSPEAPKEAGAAEKRVEH